MVVQQLSKMAVEGTGKILEGVFGEADSSPKLPFEYKLVPNQYHFPA
jgi:hypothetical protein